MLDKKKPELVWADFLFCPTPGSTEREAVVEGSALSRGTDASEVLLTLIDLPLRVGRAAPPMKEVVEVLLKTGLEEEGFYEMG